MKTPLLNAIFICTLALGASSVNAALLTYEYSGNVFSITDAGGVLSGTGISVGMPFAGTFTYDTSATPDFSFPTVASYTTGDLSLTIDSVFYFYGTSSALQIHDDSSTFQDTFFHGVNTTEFGAPPGDFSNNMQIALRDTTQNVFSSTSIPVLLDLSDFTSATIDVRAFFEPSGFYDINGTITTLTLVSSVPIPPALLLFGSGLLGLAGIARCRKD